MENKEMLLNYFLVEVFNDVLKTEELCIALGGFCNLSLKELHVIESVCREEDNRRDNSAASIAKSLRVTPGTLTIAVSLLENKGYLVRKRDDKDKRIVRIFPTELGRRADAYHATFHNEMVEDVLHALTDEEATIFIRALSRVSAFFSAKYSKQTEDS